MVISMAGEFMMAWYAGSRSSGESLLHWMAVLRSWGCIPLWRACILECRLKMLRQLSTVVRLVSGGAWSRGPYLMCTICGGAGAGTWLMLWLEVRGGGGAPMGDPRLGV